MPSTAARGPVILAALVVFGVLALAVSFLHGRYAESPSIGAFRAFYCGGQAVAMGRDPYLVEPLRSCEQSVFSPVAARGVAEPAPLPPFALAPFALLAMLPFGLALAVYVAALAAATSTAIWSLQKITGYSITFLAAALVWSDLYRNVAFGEIPPLVIGILCLSAYLLESGKVRAAALVASAALIEPHVAVASLAALFVVQRRARIPLILAGAGLALVSVVAVGVPVSVEYLARVLPVHAASEVSANDQYSLTWLLHQFHVDDGAALALGSLSYVLMTIAGIVLARRLAAHYARPALVVLVPPVFAMVGGNFIHDIQLPIALPAAIVLFSVVPARLKPFVLASTGMLAVSWLYAGRIPSVLQTVIVGVLVAMAPLVFPSRARRYRTLAAACVAYFGVVMLMGTLPRPAVSRSSAPVFLGPPTEIASERWGRYVRSTSGRPPAPRVIAEKIPFEAALLMLAILATIAAATRRNEHATTGEGDVTAA